MPFGRGVLKRIAFGHHARKTKQPENRQPDHRPNAIPTESLTPAILHEGKIRSQMRP